MKRFILFLSLFFLLTACGNQIVDEPAKEINDSTQDEGDIEAITIQETIEPIPIEKTKKTAAEIGLSADELPEGWIIQFSSPKLSTDVGEEALSLGWYDGYLYNYVKEGESDYFYSKIYLSISLYPEDKIKRVILLDKEYYKEGYVVTYEDENTKIKDIEYYYEPLPDSQIGDSSLLYRIYETDTNDIAAYYIIFIKDNVYVSMNMEGGIKDYNTFLDFAKKIEAKI